GILVSGSSSGNMVGGENRAHRNVISGNTVGVAITGGATSNVVAANYIGTTPSGDAAAGNVGAGVLVETGGNTVGGASSFTRNIISGNGQGVVLSGVNASKNMVS